MKQYTSFYFVGAGGIGMAALERYFLARGARVAGYDRTPSDLTNALQAEGVEIVADVYDAGELLTWARSFLGRVIRFESSNKFAVQRFYDDIRRMEALYERGEEE